MKHKSLIRIALVATVAALVVPAAHAQYVADNGTPAIAPATQPLPPIDAGSSLPNPVYVRRAASPDDRSFRVTPADAGPVLEVRPTTGSTFHWSEFGIGAGSAIALMLGCAAGALAMTKRSRRGGLANA